MLSGDNPLGGRDYDALTQARAARLAATLSYRHKALSPNAKNPVLRPSTLSLNTCAGRAVRDLSDARPTGRSTECTSVRYRGFLDMQVERAELPTCEASTGSARLLVLAFLSLFAGTSAGLLAAAFRLALSQADRIRAAMLVWSHGHGTVGFFVTIGICAVATTVAAWLVRRFSPHATGSGIPHVEAQLGGNGSGNPLRISSSSS